MSFVCERCKQPLRLEESLADLSPSTYDMVSSALTDRNNVSYHPQFDPDRLTHLPPAARKAFAHATASSRPSPSTPSGRRIPSTLAPGRAPAVNPSSGAKRGPFAAPTESFVVLSDSTIGAARAGPSAPPGPSTPSKSASAAPSTMAQTQRLARLSRLFDMLSARSDVDHPLCTDCTDILLGAMTEQLQEARQDRDRYARFEREMAKDKSGDAETVEHLSQSVQKLKEAERAASEELRSVERERAALVSEMAELDAEEQALEQEEQEFWEEYNRHHLEAEALKTQLASITTRYQHDLRELERLQKANVYNDAFCIGHEGGIATINGLRLGRLPDVPVEWVEINAAWGDTALLLQNLAKRYEHTFEGLRLVPLGSFSRIERVNDKSKLELYGSDDFGVSRILHNRRFDSAMVEFLECVRQVGELAARRNPSVKLPHKIAKDKIGEVSIKLSFSADEAWTRALKHLLYTLKVLNQSAA